MVQSSAMLGGLLLALPTVLEAKLPARMIRPAPDPGRAAPFAPTTYPSSSSAPVDGVIIAADSLAPYFVPLARFETRVGRPTVVRTLSTIRGFDPRSNDLAQSIRAFLRSARDLWGTRWVVLAGDHDAIPLRRVTVTFAHVEEIATDFYYADLDGTWDGNRNGTYGEVADSLEMGVDLIVGRLPASNRVEAETLVRKALGYMTGAATASVERHVILAEVLFPSNWSPGQLVQVDGAVQGESLRVRTPSTVWLRRLYENLTRYPGSEPLGKSTALAAVNQGFGVINHIGHGSRDQLSVGAELVRYEDFHALGNGDSAGLWISNNCASAGVDYESIAEILMRHPAGGAVAYVGATRDAWPGVSQRISSGVMEGIFGDPALTLGEAVEEARASLLPSARSETQERWGFFETILLGAPTMEIWRARPESLAVSRPASVALDSGSFTVTVTGGGAPVESALVVAWKDGEDYRVVETDASGTAVVPFHPGTTGAFSLAVRRVGFAPSLDSIAVTADLPAHFAISALATVDSDGDGCVQGGESFGISGLVTNSGGTASAAPLTITAEAAGAGLLVTTGSVATSALGAGGSAPIPSGLEILAPIAPGEPRTERLRIVVTDGARADTTEIAVSVTAPRALVIGRAIADSVVGDQDGVFEAGETADLVWRLGNEGIPSTTALTFSLSAPASSVGILSGSGTAPPIPSGGVATTTAARVMASAAPSGLLFDLTIADALGRTWSIPIDLDPPAAVTGLAVEGTSTDAARLRWNPVAAPDLAGYVVRRAPDDGSPLLPARILPPSPHPHVEDGGLSPLTTYRYQVAAIDSSGNEGPASGLLEVTTAPSSLPGWPAPLGASSSSSPTLSDLDGDGRPELIVGGDRVYVFRFDGTEWRDGDGNPATLGVFSTLLYHVISSPAAADLDLDGTPEIIAASWNDSTVAVFETDGAIAPGWPKKGSDPFWSSPAIGDLDGDPEPEIVIGSNGSRLYAWNPDGSEVADGDSNPATNGVLLATSGNVIGSPAIADIDGDGRREAIVGSAGGRVYAVRAEGLLPGWPFVASGLFSSSPAVGDVIPGGGLEIAIASSNDSVYVLTADGQRVSGWPRPMELTPGNGRVPSPALAPLRRHLGDPSLYVVLVGTDGTLRAFDAAGTVVPGWESLALGVSTDGSPVLADLDGDGSLEMLIGANDRRLHGFHHDGTVVRGFPIEIGAEVRSVPAVWDLDGDGACDIAVPGWDRRLHVWRYPGIFSPTGMAWPMFRHDNWRTGESTFPILTSVRPIEEPPANPPAARREAALLPNRPNPFNPITVVGFVVPDGFARDVRIEIFDVRGRLVRSLVSERPGPGYHEARWDGRDDLGREVGTGLYFYRAEIAGTMFRRKMTLLR